MALISRVPVESSPNDSEKKQQAAKKQQALAKEEQKDEDDEEDYMLEDEEEEHEDVKKPVPAASEITQEEVVVTAPLEPATTSPGDNYSHSLMMKLSQVPEAKFVPVEKLPFAESSSDFDSAETAPPSSCGDSPHSTPRGLNP